MLNVCTEIALEAEHLNDNFFYFEEEENIEMIKIQKAKLKIINVFISFKNQQTAKLEF